MSHIFSICAIGDSLTFASTGHFYSAISFPASMVYDETLHVRHSFRNHPATGIVAANEALSGWRIADLETYASELDSLINPTYVAAGGRPTRHYILSLLIGTNPQSTDPSTAAARVGTYCLARQAAGWNILLGTIPDRGDGILANFNSSYSAPYNAIIKGTGWAAAHGVAGIIDYAADANIGSDGASSNTTYFNSDKIHPKQLAADTYMAPREKAAINTLITSLGGTAQLP